MLEGCIRSLICSIFYSFVTVGLLVRCLFIVLFQSSSEVFTIKNEKEKYKAILLNRTVVALS